MAEPSPVPLAVDAALAGRRSIRRFLATPVPEATVRAILELAARTPSGANTQPWQVHVVTGAARERLAATVIAAAKAGEASADYRYYPDDWFEPYIGRRRKIGFDLYDLLGIARHDHAARDEQALRNFTFFGAPVGLIVTLDRRLNVGSWIDCSMFLQSILLAARAFGLETCAQASWVRHGGTVRRALGIGEGQVVISGVALGHADPDAPENRLVTERAAVDAFTTFHTA